MPKTMKEKVEFIRDTKLLTDYRIAKETGMNTSVIRSFRIGNADIENIRFANAIAYADLYDRLETWFQEQDKS